MDLKRIQIACTLSELGFKAIGAKITDVTSHGCYLFQDTFDQCQPVTEFLNHAYV